MTAPLPRITVDRKPRYRPLETDLDFFDLFKIIEKNFDVCFFLESLGEESHISRYSIIGFDPSSIVSVADNTLVIDGNNYQVDNPYYALRDIMPRGVLARHYAGGLVGYLSYEAMNFMEPALDLQLHPNFPTFMFGVYIDGLILDKMTGTITYFHYDHDRFNRINDLLKEPIPTVDDYKTEVTVRGHTSSPDKHRRDVETVKEQILTGNTFQCQVRFKTEYESRGET